MDTRQASPRRRPGHEARPLRGRLRGHGRRHPRRRRSAVGRGRQRCSRRWACACRTSKTRVCHIDEGFDFLGLAHPAPRLARPNRQASGLHLPVEEGARLDRSDKVRTLTRRAQHRTLADLLRRLNPVLRGWCNYFRHGVSAADLQLRRPLRLLADRRLAPQTTPRAEHAHPGPPLPPRLGDPRRRDRDVPAHERSPSSATATGARKIPTPWSSATTGSPAPAA